MGTGQGECDFDAFATIGNLQAVFEAMGVTVTDDVGPLLHGKCHDATMRTLRAPELGPGLVDVYDGDTVGRQAKKNAALFGGDTFDAAHAFEMRTLGVGDDCHGWLRDASEVADFTRVVHAHFDDRSAMAAIEFEQGERQANVVVEITLCRQHSVAEGRFQDTGDHFLARRFAIAAGDGDQRQFKATAPVSGERAKRQTRVADDDEWQAAILDVGERIDVDHGSGGAALGGACQKVVTVEIFTA